MNIGYASEQRVVAEEMALGLSGESRLAPRHEPKGAPLLLVTELQCVNVSHEK